MEKELKELLKKLEEAILRPNLDDAEKPARAILEKIDEIRGIVRYRFISEFDDGCVIESPGVYRPEDGFVEAENGGCPSDDAALVREYVALADGSELDVCPDCHDYVLRTAMAGGTALEETRECPNPDCAGKA